MAVHSEIQKNRDVYLDYTKNPTGFCFESLGEEAKEYLQELFLMLREKNIYVRYFKSPRINNYLRITIGTPEQMEILLAEIRSYLVFK